MKICFVRWRDALSQEADDTEVDHRLAELQEVGFYLGETDEAVTIAMEHQSGAVRPGRWRLTIPKVNIIEMHLVEAAKAFAKPRARKPKGTILQLEPSPSTAPDQP